MPEEQPKQYEAFLFYVDDWLSSPNVALLSLEEEGAYLNLLMRAWKQPDCGLPNDDTALAAWSKLGAAKWKKSGARLRALFEEQNGRLFNPRLMRERKNQQDYWQARKERHGKRAEAGKVGAEKRWKGRSEDPPEADSKMANASFANGKPMANAIANPMAKNSLSKSESEIENPSDDTDAQEHPRSPDSGRGPTSPPPIPNPKSADPSPPDPKQAPALPAPKPARDPQTATSPPLRVETRQTGPNGMHRPTRIEIPPGLPPEHVELARTLRDVTDGRMSPDVPDADLVRFLLAEAEAAGMPPADLRALVVESVKRMRKSSSRWRPDSWGWFRIVLPSKIRPAVELPEMSRAG
jgi:uncharacterized protein YdaU (DUF1376 family)